MPNPYTPEEIAETCKTLRHVAEYWCGNTTHKQNVALMRSVAIIEQQRAEIERLKAFEPRPMTAEEIAEEEAAPKCGFCGERLSDDIEIDPICSQFWL